MKLPGQGSTKPAGQVPVRRSAPIGPPQKNEARNHGYYRAGGGVKQGVPQCDQNRKGR